MLSSSLPPANHTCTRRTLELLRRISTFPYSRFPYPIGSISHPPLTQQFFNKNVKKDPEYTYAGLHLDPFQIGHPPPFHRVHYQLIYFGNSARLELTQSPLPSPLNSARISDLRYPILRECGSTEERHSNIRLVQIQPKKSKRFYASTSGSLYRRKWKAMERQERADEKRRMESGEFSEELSQWDWTWRRQLPAFGEESGREEDRYSFMDPPEFVQTTEQWEALLRIKERQRSFVPPKKRYRLEIDEFIPKVMMNELMDTLKLGSVGWKLDVWEKEMLAKGDKGQEGQRGEVKSPKSLEMLEIDPGDVQWDVDQQEALSEVVQSFNNETISPDISKWKVFVQFIAHPKVANFLTRFVIESKDPGETNEEVLQRFDAMVWAKLSSLYPTSLSLIKSLTAKDLSVKTTMSTQFIIKTLLRFARAAHATAAVGLLEDFPIDSSFTFLPECTTKLYITQIRQAVIEGRGEDIVTIIRDARQMKMIALDENSLDLGPVYNVTLKAYVELGMLRDAEEVIDRLKEEGYEVTRKHMFRLLSGYVACKDYNGAASVFRRIESIFGPATICEYAKLVDLCVGDQNVVAAQQLVDTMIERGITPDRSVLSKLMMGYFQASAYRQGIEIFRTLKSHPDSRFHPDLQVYTVVLAAYIKMGASINFVIKYIEDLVKIGFTLDKSVYEQYLLALINQSKRAGAERLVRYLEIVSDAGRKDLTPDQRFYNHLLRSRAAQFRGHEKTFKIYQRMKSRGVVIRAQTVAHLIRSLDLNQIPLMEELVDMYEAEEPLRCALPLRLHPKRAHGEDFQIVYMALIRRYFKARRFSDAMEACFKCLCHRGRITEPFFRIMMLLAEKTQKRDLAIIVWKVAYESAYNRRRSLALSSTTAVLDNTLSSLLTLLMDLLMKTDQYAYIRSVWKDMIRDGFGFSVQNWNALVRYLHGRGMLLECCSVSKNVILRLRQGHGIDRQNLIGAGEFGITPFYAQAEAVHAPFLVQGMKIIRLHQWEYERAQPWRLPQTFLEGEMEKVREMRKTEIKVYRRKKELTEEDQDAILAKEKELHDLIHIDRLGFPAPKYIPQEPRPGMGYLERYKYFPLKHRADYLDTFVKADTPPNPIHLHQLNRGIEENLDKLAEADQTFLWATHARTLRAIGYRALLCTDDRFEAASKKYPDLIKAAVKAVLRRRRKIAHHTEIALQAALTQTPKQRKPPGRFDAKMWRYLLPQPGRPIYKGYPGTNPAHQRKLMASKIHWTGSKVLSQPGGRQNRRGRLSRSRLMVARLKRFWTNIRCKRRKKRSGKSRRT